MFEMSLNIVVLVIVLPLLVGIAIGFFLSRKYLRGKDD